MEPTPARSLAPPSDPRDAHIWALESQCAMLQGELAALRSRVDPGMILLPPERSGAAWAILEVFWKIPPAEFPSTPSFRAELPQGGFVSSRYIEIPPTASGAIRIDPGNQPGLWLFTEITLHHVDAEGALMQPPVASWTPRNGFAGLGAARGAGILPGHKFGNQQVCKVITWENDPQLMVPLPRNPDRRARILGITCAVLDPAHAVMTQQGQQLLEQIATLTEQNAALAAKAARR